MPTSDDSLRRAQRERDAAIDRGDTEGARLLDRAIDQLVDQIDAERDGARASSPADDAKRTK